MNKKLKIGDICGSYIIQERDTTKQAAAIYWKCKCQNCGLEKSIRADGLKRNPLCKCEQPQQSLVGTISNEFIVLEKTELRASDKCIIYKCQCQNCGNIEYIASNVLRSSRKHCLKCYIKKSTLIDMTNQTYGFLRVLKKDETKPTTHENDAYWICECLNCHSIKSIRGINIRKGITRSCGCIQSIGEATIAKLLSENKISFKREYTFTDLYYKDYACKLRFDFAVFNQDGSLSHLIEYDGEQHFNSNSKYYSTEGIERDKLKNDYCLNNNIKLIRIKYNEEITLQKILGKE